MTEIRVDVDLVHAPPLVWRALTEAHLVTDWLPTTRFMVRADNTFTFEGGPLPGLEDPIAGELVSVEAPHRIVMRWSGENLHTAVAVTLEERPGGTRLTLTQSGFLGPQGTMRRRVLRSTYQQLFTGPLAATLAKLAAATPPADPPPSDPPAARRNDGGPFNRVPRQASPPSRSAPGLGTEMRSTAGPRPTTTMPGFATAVLSAQAKGVAPVQAEGVRPAPALRRWRETVARLRGLLAARDWSADRRSQAIAAGAAVLLLIAMVGLLIGKATALHPAGPPQTGGGVDGPAQASVPGLPLTAAGRTAAEPAAPVATTSSSNSAAPTSPAPPTALATAPPLTARTRTEDLDLTTYRVTVTIANPGTAPVTDWTVVIVLPLLDLDVRNVDGAVMSRTDLRVIFTPIDSTRTVPRSGTVTIRFEVQGLGVRNAPLSCTIDGHTCTQEPG